ncbi:MAG: zf-HC2 domain-containing protein [Candidatus Aminicenantes bacterium]|nr:zf-HC2 domain-containing protein [Candidatus Aminicenantes bacterium]
MKEYKCKEIKKIMMDYLSGELAGADPRSKVMENHLHTCSRCSREYAILKEIYSETRRVGDAAEAVMETIDWEENALDISRGIRIDESRQRVRARRPSWGFSLPTLGWKLAVPAMAGVFILGICLGYLLFYHAPQRPLALEEIFKPGDEGLISRLETTLTRREMQGYFLQTQLLLTDLMRQCDEDGAAAWSGGASRQRVRELLNKNRYFNQDLSNPELLSARRLLKKIEWLLYEMVELDEKGSCKELQRLQDYIRKERLLLKLRLVDKDISYKEV